MFPDPKKTLPILFFASLICLYGSFFNPREVCSQKGYPVDHEKGLEAYEKEKLAKWKRHIGKRYLVLQTISPVEFFKNPEELDRRFVIQKQKEGFLITEVVQNLSGSMNFYHVLFDSGEMGYLGADGNYLEIKTLEGSLIPLSARGNKKKEGVVRPKESSHRAIELVKRHLIKIDPMTGERISIESQMKGKAKKNPRLKWWYEAREISANRVRVIQWSEGEAQSYVVRIWGVDLLTQQVFPENESAKRVFE